MWVSLREWGQAQPSGAPLCQGWGELRAEPYGAPRLWDPEPRAPGFTGPERFPLCPALLTPESVRRCGQSPSESGLSQSSSPKLKWPRNVIGHERPIGQGGRRIIYWLEHPAGLAGPPGLARPRRSPLSRAGAGSGHGGGATVCLAPLPLGGVSWTLGRKSARLQWPGVSPGTASRKTSGLACRREYPSPARASRPRKLCGWP